MSVHEPLPESLARKYEKFYHDVLALTESASDGHALNQLKEWQKLVSSSSAQSAEAAQQKSEASYNRRHLKRIYELLQVSDYDSAIDRLAELKKDQIDPAELSHLKSSLSGAQKGIFNFILYFFFKKKTNKNL